MKNGGDAVKNKKRRIFCLFFSLLIAVFGMFSFSGCKENVSKEDREIVLAAARDLSPGEKDPYYSTVILKTWESLVGISDDGKAVPMLAERWESNGDKTEWIFHLKKDVIFQDGEPFNADAVLANFYRVTHMGYKPSSFYGYLVDRIYPGFVWAEADDPYTVHLYFKKPVPMLIYRMAGWGSAMFSPKCFDRETGDFTEIAKGTGPFQIVERKADDYTVLERFEGYHGEKARAKRIRVRVISAPEARYSAMKSGEVQGVLDLGSLTPIMAEELLKDGRFQVDSAKSTISHYLSVNGTKFPFNDVRMRKALNRAVDREQIVKSYFRGYGTPTRNFLNSTNPFSRVVPPVRDPEEARRLAQEVLGGKRVPVRFLLPQYGAARYPYKVISELIQAELAPLGLDVEIVMVDGMTGRKAMAAGDYDLSIGTRGLGNLDPTSLLYEFFDSRGQTNKASSFGYDNPDVDAAFDELSHTYELSDRAVLYDRILADLLEEPAVVPLLEDQNLAVSSKELTGYKAAVYGITLDKVAWATEGGA